MPFVISPTFSVLMLEKGATGSQAGDQAFSAAEALLA